MSKFQKKDEQLFLKIAHHIAEYPNKYYRAGKWLDQYYSDDELCAKKQEEIGQQKHKLIAEIKEIEGRIENRRANGVDERFDETLYTLKGDLFTKKQRLEFIGEFESERQPSIKERLAYALEDLYRDYQCAGVLSQHGARTILLITWVATNAEAHELNLSITKFADTPWRTEDTMSELNRFGLAPFLFLDLDIALHYQYDNPSGKPTYELNLNYLPLVHRASDKVEADKEIEKETTPNDKPIMRDSAKQWFSLEGIIQSLIKARINEQEDFMQNVIRKDELRKITREFIENAEEELFSKETKAFLDRQEKEIKKILEYITRVCELDSKHQWPPGTVDLLEELMDWESGRFKYELDNEDVDEPPMVECRITGPVTFYIEEKSDVLSKLHALVIKKFDSFLTGEIAVKSNYTFSAAAESKLRLLMRQFEDGASKYPGRSNMIMSWPFMHLMPRPPKDKFPNFELPKMREKKYSFDLMLGSPLVTSETMAKVWFVPKDETGLNRFRALATEAGQIVAGVAFDYKESLWPCEQMPCDLCSERRGKIWCFQDIPHRSINLWLQAIHMLRRTLLYYDGWDGLFDEDSDFSDKGFHKGLYKFWESKDVFLDSALVCDTLLNNSKTDKSPRKKHLKDTATETGQYSEVSENSNGGLTKAERLAYQSYEYAVSEKADLATATDNEVYDWLHENGTPDGYELPSLETWKRQVRAGRKYHRTQKNTQRAGREGRSTIKRNQIDSLSEISSQYDDKAD